MNKFILLTAILFFTFIETAYALDVAQCGNLSGHGYYIETALIKGKEAGWEKDQISKGKTQVVLNEKNEFDILYVDATENIISAKADGANIILINKEDKDFSLLLSYPLGTTEIYSFFEEGEGKFRYSLFSLKPRDTTITPKRSLMVGDCTFIKFDKIPK